MDKISTYQSIFNCTREEAIEKANKVQKNYKRIKALSKEIKKYHKAIEINDQEKINNINNCSTWDKPENRKYKFKPGTHNSVNVNEKRRRIVASGRKIYN